MARNEYSGIDEESYSDGYHDGLLDGLQAALQHCELAARAPTTADAAQLVTVMKNLLTMAEAGAPHLGT